VGDRSGFVEEA